MRATTAAWQWWCSRIAIAVLARMVLLAAPSAQTAARSVPTIPFDLSAKQHSFTTTIPTRKNLVPRSLIPSAAAYPASGSANGRWYLVGGYDTGLSVTTAYALDLTASWTTTRAAWTQLPNNPAISSTACIVSLNGTFPFLNIKSPVLACVGNENSSQPFITMLDMSKEVWSSNASALKVPNHTKGLVPVGNPLDGKIYIRGGYHTANADMMEIYDPKLDNYTSIPIPKITATTKDISQGGSGVPAAQWYSAVWSVKRSSVLYFGGRVDASDTYASAEIYEYKPALNQWGVFNTTGTPPTSREDACLAMDQNNSKLAVYGGRADDNLLRDIFVLDLASMQWSKGPSSADGRVGMACIMYDDGFLVWGGAMDTFLVSLYSPDPSVFNLTTMQWSTVYRMANTTVVPPVVGSTGKSSTFALILGLTMGAIGLGAIGAGMLLYRREKNKSAKKQGRMILQIPAERVYEPSQGSPTPLVGTPPTGTDGISMTALQSPDIPQTTSVPSTATQCGATKREVGAGRMDDDISIRTQLSGKYDEREEEKLSASQQPYRSRRRKKRTAQYQEQDTGHKIELDPIPSTTNDPVVSASKQEDPTFQPLSSRMRPDAALSSAHMHPDRSHLRRSFAEDPDEQRRDPPYNPHHHAR